MAIGDPLGKAVPGHPLTASSDPLAALQEKLGHQFRQPQLLRDAVTHASASPRHGRAPQPNERLEFLGDRVLGLVVAELLCDRFPKENEGALALRHAALVRRETLALVAGSIGLGDSLILSRGEEEAGGRHNATLLGDACEAVIAALYLDGGLQAAARFVERHWTPLLDAAVIPPQDAKTALQEWAQGAGLPLPVYEIVEVTGPPHSPRFTVSVRVRGAEPATASGSSKRSAEQAAAASLLRQVTAHGR